MNGIQTKILNNDISIFLLGISTQIIATAFCYATQLAIHTNLDLLQIIDSYFISFTSFLH